MTNTTTKSKIRHITGWRQVTARPGMARFRGSPARPPGAAPLATATAADPPAEQRREAGAGHLVKAVK
jgi:hypothetical protein